MECWRAIPGFIGEYEVSDYGRVRSLSRNSVFQQFNSMAQAIITVNRAVRARILRPGRSESGHLTVVLGRGNTRQVHALVLEAFVGPCPMGMEALHADDQPSNNHLCNLRWGTRRQNLVDAIRNGKKPIGSKVWNAKLSEKMIPKIRLLFGKVSYQAIADRYGVAEATIRQIKNGRTWKHVH